MTCSYCGTTLPLGAMFCGECGRTVSATRGTSAVTPEPEAPLQPRDLAHHTPPPSSDGDDLSCVQCASALDADDIFCGECGAVRTGLTHETARDTAREHFESDVEETRIVGRGARGERFVLQFSTGESVSVSGTGLLGRNPIPEPGEYFDSVVVISDPGRSVSKTHLEFGQEAGTFWISDRFSGNGTVVREPESSAKRCEPGKRYRVVRGTRIDVGEQFFIVS